MSKTKIEWCDEVWNPVWGCLNKCPYCYARKIAKRFGQSLEEQQFIPTWREDNFNRKFAKATKRVFVNSMSDIEYWKPEWMERVIAKIRQQPQIQFIFLTKDGWDPYRGYEFPDNVVCGLTVTKASEFPRKTIGRRWAASNWLLNIEPIHDSFDNAYSQWSIEEFDWIIIGAETGNRKDRIIPELSWFESILKQKEIPVFIKPSLDKYIPPGLIRREYLES